MKDIPQQKKPRFAGLDYRDVPNSDGDTPHTDFAGTRALNGSPIMDPIISRVKNTPQQGGKGK